MTTVYRLRRLDGTETELAVVSGRFVDPVAADATSAVDLRHLVALPGLVDAHAHLAATSIDGLLATTDEADLELMRANARRQLDAGVLLVLDKGFKSDDSLTYLDESPDLRPALEMAGGIIAEPGGYYEGFGLEVATADLPEAVAEKAKSTAQWVKLIADWPRRGKGPVPSFSDDALAAAVVAAHAHGKRVAVHTMAKEAPSRAVRAGVDSIEHGIFLTEDDLRMLGGRGGAWVPTIAAVEKLVEMLGADSSGGRLLNEGLDRVRSLLPLAARFGVSVQAGTDLSIPHGEIAVEAAALVRYGLDPEDALQAMTSAAYTYLGRAAPLEAGADADVIGFDADPREDISVLARPAFVMRRGRVIRG